MWKNKINVLHDICLTNRIYMENECFHSPHFQFYSFSVMWIGKFNDFPSPSRFYQQNFVRGHWQERKSSHKNWWKIVSSFHLVIAREKFDPREISNCVSGRASLQLANKTAGWRAHKNILCREISTRRERESPNHEHKLEFCYGLDFVERKNFNAVSLFFATLQHSATI